MDSKIRTQIKFYLLAVLVQSISLFFGFFPEFFAKFLFISWIFSVFFCSVYTLKLYSFSYPNSFWPLLSSILYGTFALMGFIFLPGCLFLAGWITWKIKYQFKQ